ncbi:MAG: hypothetical protein ACYSVY_17090, partial [Planctomycetota bacterium]
DALTDGDDPLCDGDGDGIPDVVDACPSEPEDCDGVLDTDGCDDPPGGDYDSDGLSDDDEVFVYLTDPTTADSDGDGIEDGVDGQDAGGDQGTVPSSDFTDEPDGVTWGTVTDSGGATVSVADALDPEGVRIQVSGPGGPATVHACDESSISMPIGTDIVVTCGSIEVRVIAGPVTIHLLDTIDATVPTDTTVVVAETSPGVFDVSNEPESSGSISLGGLTLAPGEMVTGGTDVDGDGWISTIDYCPTVATSWFVPLGDGDCDAWTTADEAIIGTDTGLACGTNAWPPDFDDSQVINITDVFEVLPPYFGSSPSIPDTNGDTIPDWSVRRDLSPDEVINITDVFLVLPPWFGKTCTP